MTKKEKIKHFNPNDPGDKNSQIFGLPFSIEESEIIFVPVPWEVTVSYQSGTAKGPKAIFEASFQVDLYDPFVKDPWKIGMAMDAIPKNIESKSKTLRKKTEAYLKLLDKGQTTETNKTMQSICKEINKGCAEMNEWVEKKVSEHLKAGKLVGLIGGDHSTPLGMIKALAKKENKFSILQLDAHADLRNAYEGFEFSHASIMFNAIKTKEVEKLVQVGIRDYCEEEVKVINASKGRVKTYFDSALKHENYCGKSWDKQCDEIISQLGDKVYISFDIDGLDPKLCPNTGTPVAGGLETEQVIFLIKKLVEKGKKIIGFDINEVAPGKDEWDANVAARLLYKIAALAAKSNGKL